MTEVQRNEQARRAEEGDGDALQRLVVYYHETLHGAVAARVPDYRQRHIDPDDILQDAYVSAFQSVGTASFDGAGGFYKWLERIALNRLTDAERGLGRQKRNVGRMIENHAAAAASTYPDLLDRIAGDGSSPSQSLRCAEATAAVLTSLARLTEDQRTVIKLRFLQELTVAEIAEGMRKSEDAVHMLTHRALRVLQQHLPTTTEFRLTT